MTQRLIPCAHCTQYQPERRAEGAFCNAFPDGSGIPSVIIMGRVTHREPYPGDNGVQWTPEPGYEGMFDGIPVEDEPLPASPLGN